MERFRTASTACTMVHLSAIPPLDTIHYDSTLVPASHALFPQEWAM